MPRNPDASLFVGNLDERVDERILYEVMVQAGPLLDIYLPRDKETKRHKGYGFAEYVSEESAHYALKLFSGIVSLYNKSLRFAISGRDKFSQDKFAQVKLVDSRDINGPVTAKPVETSYQEQGKSIPSFNIPSINNYSCPTLSSQGYYLSNLAHFQDDNSRFLSLGQLGLRTKLPSRGHPYNNLSR